MRIKAFAALIRTSIEKKKKVLAVSAPGIGKTETVVTVCQELNVPCILMHPAISDPTDFKGLPSVGSNKQEAVFLPFGELVSLIKANTRTVCFIDDIGQAPMGVQAPLMQLIHGGHLNGVKISEEVVFMGATNDVNQMSGVSGLIEPLKSRWDSIVKVDYNADDFTQWLIAKDFSPECVAFVRTFPNKISDFKASKDMTNSPCPRTVAAMFRWHDDGVNDLEVFEGAAGRGIAAEFTAFLKLMNDLPNLDDIMLNPDKVAVPTEPSLLYAVAGGLACKVDEHNFDKALRYIQRCPQKKYEVLFTKDSIDRNKKIGSCRAFQHWAAKNANVIM